MTPGVSILRTRQSGPVTHQHAHEYSRLALEVFHDVEKPVVDVRLVMKLHLDLVEVRQGILRENEVSISSEYVFLIPLGNAVTRDLGAKVG